MFGQRVAGVQYIARPSAYAVILDEAGAVAVVLTPEGTFLPGGGIDAGETVAQAVEREVLEECGLLVRPGEEIARAVQFAYSKKEVRFYEKRSVFLRAAVQGRGVAVETDHRLVWLEPEAAAAEMTHESHAWVLRYACADMAVAVARGRPS